MQYLDGETKASETLIGHELDGGGALTFGYKVITDYYLTGLNLWDRVLYAHEIQEIATSCFKGLGNVKNWFDLTEKVKLWPQTLMGRSSPSQCRSPIEVKREEEKQEELARQQRLVQNPHKVNGVSYYPRPRSA